MARLRAGYFWAAGAAPRRVLAQHVRRHNARGIAGHARQARGACKHVDPIGCMRDIKAAQNALQGHCERCGIFCGYSRNGTGMPTARENGRRRGERGAERTSGRARSSAGRWAVPGAIWGGLPRSGHRKSPGRIRGGGYLKRRAALKSVASGSRSRNKTGMRSPPILLYHICAAVSRGTSAPTWPRRRKCPRRRAPLHQSASWPSLPV